MKAFEKFAVRQSVGLPLMSIMFPVLYLGAEAGMILSGVAAAGTYVASTAAVKQFQVTSDSKRLGMTRSEYKSVLNQIREAKAKIKELQSHYYRVRSISSFKQLMEMTKLANKIVSIVQKNPRKFYQAESFFYSHLDSAIELTSKYTLLVGQPVKDKEMKIALQDTRETLRGLKDVMEEDLKKVLAGDVEQLRMELDYAQLAVGRRKDPLLIEEKEDTPSKGDVTDDREPTSQK